MFERIAHWLWRRQSHPTESAVPSPASLAHAPHCDNCPDQVTTHITEFRSHALISEKHFCYECARIRLGDTWSPPHDGGSTDPDHEVEVEVQTIVISDVHDQQVVVLKEIGGPRRFPIIIGICEATAMDRSLRGIVISRPLTFDAWLSTLHAAGARLRAAVIRHREDTTYFADLRLAVKDGLVSIDLRPSDAIHLAIKARAPIRIPERLLVEITSPIPEPG